MSVGILKYSPDEWREYADSAHKLVFKKNRDPLLDRISFALLAHNDESAVAYVTCRELDAKSLYWQFGGVLDEFRGFNAVKCFRAFFDYCSSRYERITALVKNDNVNCLHLMMKYGFRAIGMRNFHSEIFLEMYWENTNAI